MTTETPTAIKAAWRASCGHCNNTYAMSIVVDGDEERSREFVSDGKPSHAVIERVVGNSEMWTIGKPCIHMGGTLNRDQGVLW